MFSKLTTAFLAAVLVFMQVNAQESHTVTFTNNCGYGTPYLRGQNGDVLSTGGPYTSDGSLLGLIAYLQTGNCGDDGESCTLVEVTLENSSGSAADISLVPPHEFSVTSGFGYYNGCDGVGEDCTSADCPCAFTDATNGCVISCGTDNVDIAITFCD